MLNSKGIRELAYVVRINEVRDIEGVNNQVAVVNGWTVFVKRDEFKAGDLAVYFEIDSKVPEIECFEFLRKYNFKVRTQKYVRGLVISQGLVIKPEELGLKNVKEGDFLTEKLGVIYYDPEDNKRKSNISGKYMSMRARHPKLAQTRLFKWLWKREWGKKLLFFFLGRKKDKPNDTSFPNHFPYIHKSDEERIENMPWILENKEPWIKTLKIDGTSSTYILERKKKNKFEFYVLSRNVRQKTPDQKCFHESNVYWEMAKKYNIEEFLIEQLNIHEDWSYVCLQGETAGPNVQGNPHKLKEVQLFGFNFIDSKSGRWNSIKAKNYVAKWGIQWVPIIDEHYILPDTMEEMKNSADGLCELPGASGLREGYVYRDLNGEKSFKNVSNAFLLSKK